MYNKGMPVRVDNIEEMVYTMSCLRTCPETRKCVFVPGIHSTKYMYGTFPATLYNMNK